MEEAEAAIDHKCEEINELVNGVRAARALIMETGNDTFLAAIKMFIYQLLYKSLSCSDLMENLNRTKSKND